MSELAIVAELARLMKQLVSAATRCKGRNRLSRSLSLSLSLSSFKILRAECVIRLLTRSRSVFRVLVFCLFVCCFFFVQRRNAFRALAREFVVVVVVVVFVVVVAVDIHSPGEDG